MSYKAVYTDQGASDSSPVEEPIETMGENGSATSSLPLLREFCVPRDLSVVAVRTQRGPRRHELQVMTEG